MNDICRNICPCSDCSTDIDDCVLAKAYEKQTPKNVITHIQKKDIEVGKIIFKTGTKTRFCPVCATPISCDKYCRECGQALDRTSEIAADDFTNK